MMIIDFGEKCIVGDVTLGDGRVVSSSGFRFPVGLDLYFSNCRRYLIRNEYFRFGKRWKIAEKNVLVYFYFFNVWRAIPDVYGRQLSEAKLVEEGGCAPLPTIKYEPLLVGSDRLNNA